MVWILQNIYYVSTFHRNKTKFIYLFLTRYFKGRVTKERKREKEYFHSLIHSPNVQSWVQAEVSSQELLAYLPYVCRGLRTCAIFCCVPGQRQRAGLIDSSVFGFWTGTQMGCWCHNLWLHQLCHNAGSRENL